MQKHSIATIINYCSNEYRFLKPCIEQATHFSETIIIPVCDHFFDGTPEKKQELEAVFEQFPNVSFILYPFLEGKKLPKKYRELSKDSHFWHSLSRYVGYKHLDQSIEYVLFLDVDEIIDGKKFLFFLDQVQYQEFSVFRLANYWYFREPIYQAEQWEDTPVMVKRSDLDQKILLHKEERNAIYEMVCGKKKRYVTGQDGLPMIHHYSWVRSKEEMLKKVLSWGHRGDQDWKSLVENEFSHDFEGEDFIHHYAYKKVPAFIDVDLEIKPTLLKEPSLFYLNVISLTNIDLRNLLKRKNCKNLCKKINTFFKKILAYIPTLNRREKKKP